jgi:diguanylate cyclase (GGDEF)-like protein
VARYGGEEFVVVLPGTPDAAARQLAERMCSGVRALGIEHAHSSTSFLTISIGCATAAPAAGDAPERLLESADRMLYRSKEEGRNRVT